MLNLVKEKDMVAKDNFVTLLAILVTWEDVELDTGRIGIHAHFKLETVLPLVCLFFGDLKIST